MFTDILLTECLLYFWQVAEIIRHVIDAHTEPIPAVLEIPSKECPYDASKDSILRRAKVCTHSESNAYSTGHY